MKISTLIIMLFVASLLTFSAVRIGKVIQFDRNCEGHLKRAADANTVELVSQELDTALSYMEKKGMTKGYTSIIYTTPDEDVGFWYKNIKGARQELNKVTDNTTQLEKTNMLMKLRETLLDDVGGEYGQVVTCPDGISVAPHNVAYAVWFWLSFFGIPVSAVWKLSE